MIKLSNDSSEKYRIGFDVGGTFTDFTLLRERDGTLNYFKVPSTPHDPSIAIAEGIAHLIDAHSIVPRNVTHVGHGTTVATNMVIERRGERTALLTTRGFRDVLEIGRQSRPSLYNYDVQKPIPLAARELRFEIDERINAAGEVLRPVDTESVIRAITEMKRTGVGAIAICFLHSYRNASHERAVAEMVRAELPDAYVCISSEILPEFREYERMSTTALNAYVGPRMSTYMQKLQGSVERMGINVEPQTVHSNGGLMSPAAVCVAPVRTCLSGPAAGVVGAVELGRVAGFPNLITFDVGGTSTDVSLIAESALLYTQGRTVADHPVKTQMIDIHVIGAGGGSIARVDEGGALKVGPQSAGAFPGPVAYGRGGELATLTDAHVALGRLDPVSLLDGRMKIYSQEARKVIQHQIAEPLGLTVEEAAYGMLKIANANMARAVRSVSMEKGYNVRDFALCSFGGAGGLHASELARDCGLRKVLIPQEPGTMCARGILLSDISMDFVKTLLARGDEDGWEALSNALAELLKNASQWLEHEGIELSARRILRQVEARYLGQNFEIAIDFEDRDLPTLRDFLGQFSAAHIREYGYDADAGVVELVNCRVRAVGAVSRAPWKRVDSSNSLEAAKKSERPVFFEETGWSDTPVYHRPLLPINLPFDGPAIIDEMSSTVVILPRQTVEVDDFGNLIVSVSI
ncbi:5-oxoprolinase [Burkholderia sp. Leaf177]|uniref:hydantoinase/oxoprolinase family protein n=1 Tax=Burkholderia sp. Leaf177 TaxID=1736287 RepID=UPI0006F5C889|nr:hydantoinase/oxoprolinase family protein [Burkholderia sp. Leaf177]KQR77065.1 5-oxoprolinase [Burkholderia sp. Leaf177]